MERVGIMDCGAYSTKYAVVSRNSRHMSDVRVAEERVVASEGAPSRGTSCSHWSQQLPPVVSRFAEQGADLTLLLLLDVHTPQHEKEKMLHLAFETVGCQKGSLCYAAATSLFAVGQVTGVCADIGYTGVRITPVTRGVVETQHAFSSGSVGAARVDAWLRDGQAPSTRAALEDPADLTSVKMHLFSRDATPASNEPLPCSEEVALPDGNKITITVPSHCSRTAAEHLLRSSRVSVPHALRECCEMMAIATGEVYPWLLTGASAAAPNVSASLTDALRASAICADATEWRAKNTAQAAVEGGVILSQLGTFKGMCVTADMYAEEGPQRCVHMKTIDYR